MLYRFHVVLVATGILFSFGFAVYEILRGRPADSTANLIVAAVFLAGGAALVVYLRNIQRRGIRS